MFRPIHGCLSLLAALLLCTGVLAQPKIVITTVGSDLSPDGNHVIGTILDENVYGKFTLFTRGSGFTFHGPVVRGGDGALSLSEFTGNSFFASWGLYNGFYGSTPWPQTSPGLFGNYVGTRPCCNGTTCTVMDASQCLAPNYSVLNTSSCSPNPCPSVPPVSGGCCNALTGVCTYTTQAACTSPNYWIGGTLACGNYPCSHGHNLPFRFDSTTDAWTNCGGIPNNTGGIGQGASKCDGGIASPYDISKNGRFIVGGSWYGGFGATGCSTRGFIYDNNDGSTQMLPMVNSSTGCQNYCQAWAVSNDGMFVLGRDTHVTTDPNGAQISCNGITLAVWERDLATGNFLTGRTLRVCCTGSVCTLVDPFTCTNPPADPSATSCTPSPCPATTAPGSGACCDASTFACTTTAQGACAGFWIGNGACSPNACATASVGACCNGSICSVSSRTSCTGANVAYFPTSCTANPCPATTAPGSGACCNSATFACTTTASTGCSGGFWIGNGACSPNDCGAVSVGACCNGSLCSVLSRTACTGTSISYAGATCGASTCPTTAAPSSGACCQSGTFACTVTAQSACSASFWVGNGSCSPNACGQFANRVCCTGATCAVVAVNTCTSGSIAMVATTCSGSTCPPTIPGAGACCNTSNMTCTATNQAACTGLNIWIGSGGCTAGANSCGAVTPGACCNQNTCTVVTSRIFCTAPSVVFAQTTCTSNPCPAAAQPPAIGACCNTTTFACSSTSQSGCVSPAYWIGSDVCTPNGCATASTGACCNQNTCTVSTRTACVGPSVAFSLAACTSNPCPTAATPPASGACCNSTSFACTQTDKASCVSPAYWIASASCAPNACGQASTGACCNQNTCTVVSRTACTGPMVSFSPTACGVNPCPANSPPATPPASGACCHAQSLNCTATALAACPSPYKWIGNAACSPRNPCLPSTEVLLDSYGGTGLLEAVMTPSGTTIAAPLNEGTATYVLSDSTKAGQLCKYVRNSGIGAWDRTVLGFVAGAVAGDQMVPTGISDDGNTIVGSTQVPYGSGHPSIAFIWKPTLNGGVPMAFTDYVQSLNGGQPYPPTGGMSLSRGMSADGTAVLVSVSSPAPESCPANSGLQDLPRTGVLYLDGSNIPCQPPVIAGGPYDVAEREYTRYGMVGNVFFAGSYPITAQWQRESPSFSNNWVDIQDSCGQFTIDATWTYEGTHGFQLRVNELADPSVRDGRYRVVLTNACGSATSAVANFATVGGACCAYDLNTGGATCTVVIGTRCTQTLAPFGLAGVYLGDGTTCAPSGPCDAVLGACCSFNGSVQCVVDLQTHCTLPVSSGGLAGNFRGNQTTCESDPTCATVSGACCYSGDGISSVGCTVELQSRCVRTGAGQLNGAYAGNLTACAAGDTCPPTTPGVGACCFNPTSLSDIVCAVHQSGHCTATYTNGGLQGSYLGDGVACTTSICTPAESGTGASIGACCFTDPNNPASGTMCIITYIYNCSNYPNGSNDANAAPFNRGLGGNFYTAQCCSPSMSPPIDLCNTSAACSAAEGACIHTPFDNSTGVTCTIQVRPNRCTRRYNSGGLFGAFVPNTHTCSPALIASNSGACCYQPTNIDGAPQGCPVCLVQPQSRCETVNNGGLSGVYGGNGTSCTPVVQCPAQYGACCNYNGGTTGTCTVMARSACTGTLMGLTVTSCVAGFCPQATFPAPSGACCNVSTLACTVSVQAACPAPSFWIYSAACTAENPCSQPSTGACCVFTSCSVTCQSDCTANAGTYQGGGSSCTPNDPCAPPAGVCCRGATCSTAFTSAAACEGATTTTATGGPTWAFVTSSSICNVGVNADGTYSGGLTSITTPCCFANYNHSTNGLEVQDIFDFLNDWFAGRAIAIPGGDGTSTTGLAVQNIFNFLNAWFAGGCS